MTRTLYDSVTAAAIPRDAELVAGYLPPSRYAWSAADWARFPGAVKVRIAIFASVNDGQVLDVEPGDATPAEAPGWVKRRRAAGVDPTVYCNASTWPQVRAEFRRQNVREPHYWIAKYDGVAELPAGAVAKQYANPPVHGRGHYDLSIVADHWPGVDTTTKEDDDMRLDDKLPPVILADGKPHELTVGDVLRGMAQYIPGQGGAVKAPLTNHPMGQYVSRILAIGELTDDEAKILAALKGEGVTPEEHAHALAEVLPGAVLQALIQLAKATP